MALTRHRGEDAPEAGVLRYIMSSTSTHMERRIPIRRHVNYYVSSTSQAQGDGGSESASP